MASACAQAAGAGSLNAGAPLLSRLNFREDHQAVCQLRLGSHPRPRQRQLSSRCMASASSASGGEKAMASSIKVKDAKEEKKEKKQKEEKKEKVKAAKVEEEEEDEAAKESKGKKGEKKSSKEEAKEIKSRKIRFAKYQGIGNNFIMIDNRKSEVPKVSPEEAVKICDKNFGVGGDGVIFVLPGQDGADYTMRIFNNDGSEPEMCGNGIRCMARFLQELDETQGAQRYTVSTLAGIMVLDLREDGQVRVDMGPPILEASLIPTNLPSNAANGAVVKAPLEIDGVTWEVTCVSMGNPHCITFSNSQTPEGLDVAAVDLHRIGPLFETNHAFPARINTEFVEVVSPTELRMRVWERGAGPTLACGTGACALVVAAVLEGRAERKCLVHLPGGPLEIEWGEDNRVYMTGPAELVFHGKLLL